MSTEARIRISYDVTTEESCEVGDFAETGWEDEEGVLVEPEEGDRVTPAVEFLREHSLEASCSPFSPGAWYTELDVPLDERRLSFHLVGFTPEEEREINRRLTGRSV